MKLARLLLALLLGLGLSLALAQPVFAGLKVVGAKIEAEVTPSSEATYNIQVIDNSDDPMDIGIEVRGYGFSADGIIQVLEPDADDSPYSAREYLSLSMDSFHLEPGDSQNVTVTARIPAEVGDGGRYAIVFIHTVPAGGSGFAVVTAVAVPVRLTISGSKLTSDSEITEVSLSEIAPQEPLEVTVALTNNGNCHYKPQVEVKISSQGKAVATCPAVNSSSSLIPGYTQEFNLSIVADEPLPAGTYEIDIVVRDDAGKLVTNHTCALELSEALLPTAQEPESSSEEPTTPAEGESLLTVTPQSSTNWTLIWSITGGVVFLGLLIYFSLLFLRRRW